MKLHEHIQRRMNLVGRYGPEGIDVNGERHPGPLILAPGFVHAQWISGPEGLDTAALEPLWPLQAMVVLLGGKGFSSEQLKTLRRTFAVREVALEVMDLGAACRTYNVLAQEERPVAALLFPG